MKDHKSIENEFTWVPLDKRKSIFGGSVPPRKSEIRKPLLWLAQKNNELYLVNFSGGLLDSVVADSGGFQTVDDDVMVVSNNEQYEYLNVKPNTAIKIEEYDGFYDLDYILQVCIRVKSIKLGSLDIQGPPEKGGAGETVLLWDTGESGKFVSINKI
jgi:hypothetical protein